MRKGLIFFIFFIVVGLVCQLYAEDVFEFARMQGRLKYITQLRYNQEGTVTLVRSNDTDFIMLDPNGNNVDQVTLASNQTCTLTKDKVSISYRFSHKRKRALLFYAEEKYMGTGIGDPPQSRSGAIRVRQYNL
ncbi:MAG: hypothetical protein PHQ52_03885 [Candidatus Omnitrophica bacterium]|nr:hypothetical protein [Candidatus Omnitrophota bacterium]